MWNAMDYPVSSLVGLLGLHGDLWSKRDPDLLRMVFSSPGVTLPLFPVHICPSRVKPV